MKRKYWCEAMRKYNQKYDECDLVTMDELKKITTEKIIALAGKDQPLQVNSLSISGFDEAKKRGELIWSNTKGTWSATPFGEFVD